MSAWPWMSAWQYYIYIQVWHFQVAPRRNIKSAPRALRRAYKRKGVLVANSRSSGNRYKERRGICYIIYIYIYIYYYLLLYISITYKRTFICICIYIWFSICQSPHQCHGTARASVATLAFIVTLTSNPGGQSRTLRRELRCASSSWIHNLWRQWMSA